MEDDKDVKDEPEAVQKLLAAVLAEKKAMEDYDFIHSTDRKSIFAQIKALVTKAQEVSAEELTERRNRLKFLLEEEDKRFELEFSNKVKSRIDEEIHTRKEQLIAIKEQHDKRQREFLDRKRIQQVMQGCYEIREALRKKDLLQVKICQEEQILENQRKKRVRCADNKYWLELNKRRWDEFDRQHAVELCRREQMRQHLCQVLDKQVEEHENRREQQMEEKRQDAVKVNAIIEELRLEEFDAKHQASKTKNLALGAELRAEIARHRAERDAKWRAEKEEHAEFIRETQRLEAEEKCRLHQKKLDLQRATHEFLGYVHRMRNLEQGIEKMLDDRTEDLHKVDVCTKTNLAEIGRKKAEKAAKCHEFLKRQMCEEAERRRRWEAEAHEDKMIENRFVHPEVTREMIVAKQTKYRESLDEQLVDMSRARAEEALLANKHFLKAIDDPADCRRLAEEYISQGVDFLAPHPNWRIYSCPRSKYVERPPLPEHKYNELLANASIDKCPCPIAARHNCGFMASQKQCETDAPPGPPPSSPPLPIVTEQVLSLDVPPEGRVPRCCQNSLGK